MSLLRIFTYALSVEQAGLEFFSERALRSENPTIVQIYQRLTVEERGHVEYIKRLIDKQQAGERVKPSKLSADVTTPNAEVYQAWETAVGEQIESGDLSADVAALRMAYLIERDLSEFYRQAADYCDDHARAALLLLATWEADHEKLFKSLYDKAFSAYLRLPWD